MAYLYNKITVKGALLFLLVLLTACANNAEKYGLPLLNKDVSIYAVPICYNDGCESNKSIVVRLDTWKRIQQLFNSPINAPINAADERLAIRQAVALLEQEAALSTPIDNDKPKNNNETDIAGRQDCIDESTNTTHFLYLLQNAGLLKWHQVDSRVFRALFLLDQHFAAQIIHRETGARYVVDSWFRYNGELPYIQRYKSWSKRLPFSKFENPM